MKHKGPKAHANAAFMPLCFIEAERSYIAALAERDTFRVAVRADDNTGVGSRPYSVTRT
jgi:hypothetical protein